MSIIDEDVVTVPWIGPMSCKNTLTVIVISANAEIIEKIADALVEIHKTSFNYRWKLKVLRSFNLETVLELSQATGRIAIDFVVVAIDTSRMYCLDWANETLGKVDTALRSRRVILINTGINSLNEMTVSPGELIDFRNTHKLDLITADKLNSEHAESLARRLLKYLEVTVGVNTGIPNLNL